MPSTRSHKTRGKRKMPEKQSNETSPSNSRPASRVEQTANVSKRTSSEISAVNTPSNQQGGASALASKQQVEIEIPLPDETHEPAIDLGKYCSSRPNNDVDETNEINRTAEESTASSSPPPPGDATTVQQQPRQGYAEEGAATAPGIGAADLAVEQLQASYNALHHENTHLWKRVRFAERTARDLAAENLEMLDAIAVLTGMEEGCEESKNRFLKAPSSARNNKGRFRSESSPKQLQQLQQQSPATEMKEFDLYKSFVEANAEAFKLFKQQTEKAKQQQQAALDQAMGELDRQIAEAIAQREQARRWGVQQGLEVDDQGRSARERGRLMPGGFVEENEL